MSIHEASFNRSFLFCDLACDVVVLQRPASLGSIASQINMVRLVARIALVRRSIAAPAMGRIDLI